MTSDAAKRRYQEIAELLARRIEEEGYRPGDKFPTERQISVELGISRSLVREAFIVLEIEGYLDVRKGSGSYVAAGEKISLHIPKADYGPFELLQARQLLERSIAGCAATTITKSDTSGTSVKTVPCGLGCMTASSISATGPNGWMTTPKFWRHCATVTPRRRALPCGSTWKTFA